ncbi:hypothetical protein ACFLUT_00475 [Chloroflexota bacterium]
MCDVVVRAWRVFKVATALVATAVLCALLLPALGPSPSDEVAVDSCTVFAVSKDDAAFLASNEDFREHDSYWWTEPGEEGNFGVLFFGLDDLRPRGGMNEEGLCYDATGLPHALLNRHFDRTPLTVHFPIIALRECATVEEVVALAQTYDWGRRIYYQVMFADATGDAVVISPGADGELAYTRKREGNSYVAITNFNCADTKHGDYPCERYETATLMLDAVQANGVLGPEICTSILQRVSQTEAEAYTLYSSICDPVNGQIHLYCLRQYDHVAVLDVAEELAAGHAVHRMSDLFPQKLVLHAQSQLPVSSDYPWRTAVTVVVVFVAMVAIGRIEICGRCREAQTCALMQQAPRKMAPAAPCLQKQSSQVALATRWLVREVLSHPRDRLEDEAEPRVNRPFRV